MALPKYTPIVIVKVIRLREGSGHPCLSKVQDTRTEDSGHPRTPVFAAIHEVKTPINPIITVDGCPRFYRFYPPAFIRCTHFGL